ncbi:MAG: D-2-hydroxyacid dehydrogenase [Lawsonibacter sp.]
MSEYILNLLPVNEEEKRAFEAIAPDATHVYAGRRTLTQEQIQAATVLFGWPRAEDLAKAKNLKWFQTMWAGTDEYEGEGILPAGAVLTSSSGSNSLSVSEHMLASLLALCRRLPAYRDSQRNHTWKDEGAMKSVYGSTVLVLGAGHIGAAFAQRCRALGARTLGVKRNVTGPVDGFDQVFPMDELDALLPQADVVALVLPHSTQTIHLMNEARIARMKEDAILISSGRGSVLDQEALARAMQGGKLWGAALDVTEPEPLPPDSPLWDIPNLLLTPHVAGGMRLEITRKTCVQMALDNLRRYLAGEPLANRVK